MKTYRILSTIRYKGKDLKSGHVVLDDEMATELLASGHIMGPIAVHDDNGSSTSSPSAEKESAPVAETEEVQKASTAKLTRATKK